MSDGMMLPSQVEAGPRLRLIPLSLIDDSDRLRPVDEGRAAAIAESMAVSKQLEAILVRPLDGHRYALVIGGHRLSAARSLGWSHIEAKVEDMTALDARLAEIDENLYRHELSALDRAVFLAERKRVWGEIYPDTAHGGDRKSLKTLAEIKSPNWRLDRFTTDAAEKLNISERTVQRACMVAASLSPEVVALVRRTYLASHAGDLEKLARLDPVRQLEAVQRLASGEVRTLAGATGRTERNSEDKLFDAFTALWARAPAAARRRMLTYIKVSPAEVEAIVNPRGVKSASGETRH